MNGHRQRRPEGRGITTVEFAVGLLAAVIVLSALTWMILLIGIKIATLDAAGAVARQAARRDAAAVRSAELGGPDGAQYRVSVADQSVSVLVSVDARPVPGLPSYRITAVARAVTEPDVGAPR